MAKKYYGYFLLFTLNFCEFKNILATCQFHHEFLQSNEITPSNKRHGHLSLEIYCDRSTYIPVWKVKRRSHHPYSLPPCVFAPRYCQEDSLKTIGNGEAIFTPGQVIEQTGQRELIPHSASIQCNDNGFYMSVQGKIWRLNEQVRNTV